MSDIDLRSLNTIINNINHVKDDNLHIDFDQYKPWFVNRTLSYHPDTVLLANTINCNSHLDSRLQYDFLLNTVRPRRRYSKRNIDKEFAEKITAITKYYSVTHDRALSIIKILNESQINEIIDIVSNEHKESKQK